MAREQLESVAAALRRNRMEAVCVDTAAEVVPLIQSWLNVGDTVAVGGSRSLEEVGVLSVLRSGEYRFLDRYASGLTPEQVRAIFVSSFDADAYLCSANAVTERGEVYCVDGNGNRIAAMAFGPRSVILVVGNNKIVPDLDAAERRVKTVAAPQNTARLGCTTPCAESGECCQVDGDYCTDGCGGASRICCSYLALGYQRTPGRIKVILVDEPLGF